MRKPGEQPGIVEAMHDKAIKEGAVETQARKMKKIVIASRNNRSRVFGSCVDPKDKKRGEVVQYSSLQIAVFEVFERLREEWIVRKSDASYTDIVLRAVLDWDRIARELESRDLIHSDELYSPTAKLKGKCRITAPWVNLAIKEIFFDDFVKIFKRRCKKRNVKSPKDIGDFEIRQQVSSITTGILRAFDIMGLTMTRKDKVGPRGMMAWYLKEMVLKYSFDELHFLYSEGRKILDDQKVGKFDFADQLGPIFDDFDDETITRTIKIRPGKRAAVEQFVEIEEDGTVTVKISYC